MKRALMAVLLASSFCVAAQTVTDAPPKADEKKADEKKAAAKKPAPRKPAEPSKTAAPRKPAPPKKPAAPKKPAEPPKTTVYKNDPKAPVLHDKQGNVIPTNPEAYDVSSAVGKK